ncbi:hypothetical protein [Streptomyces sp. NPDC047928]|uniref:hypothetical protein n=1 Tax=unclassified Streptomyces TaxID=2593676 RepID=UPI0037223CAA
MTNDMSGHAQVQEAIERAVLSVGATESSFEHRPTEEGDGWVVDWEGKVDGVAADLSVIGYDGTEEVTFFVDAWLLEGVAKADIPAVIEACLGRGARIKKSGRLFWSGVELTVPLPAGQYTSSVRNPSDAPLSPWEKRAGEEQRLSA